MRSLKLGITEEELGAAIEALISWFESQDLEPRDASIVMVGVIGIALQAAVKEDRALIADLLCHKIQEAAAAIDDD